MSQKLSILLTKKKLLKTTAKILSSCIGAYYGWKLYSLDEKFYENQLMPLVHRFFDAEKAHLLALKLAKYNFLISSSETQREYPELQCSVFGKNFKNPFGIAAGFDKSGEALKNLQKCGIGFVEIGSVTPLPQQGNEKPRVFRLIKDKAIINRYGFNNDGSEAVKDRVQKAFDPLNLVPLGINLGKNKLTKDAAKDYGIGAKNFVMYSDYLVINVSSPNTPGLRALQSKTELIKILNTIHKSIAQELEKVKEKSNINKKPIILLKIAPDLNLQEQKDIAQICLDEKNGVNGLIVSNTTVSRPNSLQSNLNLCQEQGGLSGAPLCELSTKIIANMYEFTKGKVPIIGCGGVFTGEDAYKKIRAGASLIQFYTGLIYQGFPITGRLKRELTECLKRDSFSNINEAIGADHRK